MQNEILSEIKELKSIISGLIGLPPGISSPRKHWTKQQNSFKNYLLNEVNGLKMVILTNT
jgi:hypothetical protein